ncbi:hypothetical protein A6U87_20835 [Rhizobium sp. AC44/96]|nr:hypothetical protein A6U87_20835 [Rhizobium sp. AC44/96]
MPAGPRSDRRPAGIGSVRQPNFFRLFRRMLQANDAYPQLTVQFARVLSCVLVKSLVETVERPSGLAVQTCLGIA